VLMLPQPAAAGAAGPAAGAASRAERASAARGRAALTCYSSAQPSSKLRQRSQAGFYLQKRASRWHAESTTEPAHDDEGQLALEGMMASAYPSLCSTYPQSSTAL
jgi:hypothetical protein